MAGQGDGAVAGWVRAIGGRAVIEDGRLREISLASTGVSDELLRNLEGLKHLRKLALGSTEIGNLGVQHLATLTGLEELDLDGATISDEGLAPLAGLTDLRELWLSHTPITGSGLEVPAGPPAREAAPVQLAHQRSGTGAPVGPRLAAGPRPGLYRRDRFRPGSPGVAGGPAPARPGGHGRRRQGTPDAGTPDGAQRASCSATRGSPTRRCPNSRPSSISRSWR